MGRWNMILLGDNVNNLWADGAASLKIEGKAGWTAKGW